MNAMTLACPKCGDLGTCYLIDLTTYWLEADTLGRVVADEGTPDDAPDWVWGSVGLERGINNAFCQTCYHRFGIDEIKVLETYPDGRTVPVVQPSGVVGRAVELLVEADLRATHEWRNHIVILRDGLRFHWGTVNETWQADVTSGDREVGHCESEVPSDSTDPFAIFAAIYLETTTFREGRP